MAGNFHVVHAQSLYCYLISMLAGRRATLRTSPARDGAEIMAHAMHTPDTTYRDTAVAPALQQAPGESTGEPMAAASRGRERRWRQCIRRQCMLAGLVGLLLGASIPYGVWLWQHHQSHESTDDASVVGNIVPSSTHVNAMGLLAWHSAPPARRYGCSRYRCWERSTVHFAPPARWYRCGQYRCWERLTATAW